MWKRNITTTLWPVLAVLLSVLATPLDARELRLLAFGDSLTAGYGLAESEGFTVRLETALRARDHQVTVINAGRSGDTSTGGRTRLDWWLEEAPDAVLLELGANDGLRGIDPALTHENLDWILNRLDAAGLPVLLAGMEAPANYGPEYADEFRSVFARLAERHDVVWYPFFLEGIATRPELNQRDGIHPNPRGVDELVRRILPFVEELLARVPAPR
ncbi:MAG: arylesterase [Alphaproteobacteria bacterium]|nr:arylesterase [Alphaproteobacteria bacterium]